MYQRKVDVDMLNAVKSVLADILSVSPLSELRLCWFEFKFCETINSPHTLHTLCLVEVGRIKVKILGGHLIISSLIFTYTQES